MTSTPSVLIPDRPRYQSQPGARRRVRRGRCYHHAQVPLQALRDGETKLVDHQILALARRLLLRRCPGRRHGCSGSTSPVGSPIS